MTASTPATGPDALAALALGRPCPAHGAARGVPSGVCLGVCRCRVAVALAGWRLDARARAARSLEAADRLHDDDPSRCECRRLNRSRVRTPSRTTTQLGATR